MKKVLGLGNALVDILVKIKTDKLLEQFALPKGSMQLVNLDKTREIIKATQSEIQTKVSGGSAANTINGLSNLGVNTGFIGKTGIDDLGEFFKKDLENNNINPFILNSSLGTGTGCCNSIISNDQERTMATYLGAAIEMTASDLQNDFFKGYDYFHIEGYLVQNHELIEKALELAHNKKMTISLDLAAYNVVNENFDFLHHIIEKYVDIVFANEDEAKAYTGIEVPKEAAKIIAEKSDIAIVKTGEKGSVIFSENNFIHTGIINAFAVDTTGAGDLYASGFLYGLLQNKPLNRCGQIAAITSGNVVEVIGTKMDEKRWDKIKQTIKIV